MFQFSRVFGKKKNNRIRLPRRLRFEGLEARQMMTATPAAPAAFVAQAASSTQVNLSWHAVPGASSYQVDEWNNGWKAIAAVTNGTGYSVNGLSPGTRYYFDVGATNSAGTSWANYQSVTTSARLSAPAAPSFTATAGSTTRIGLAWGAVSGATSYLIQQSEASGWVTIASLGSNATTYNAFGLNAGTTYSFRLAAVNSAGTTWANPKAATTFYNAGNLSQSNNWSGYVIHPNSLVSEVAGTWVVPTTVGTESGSKVSIWVGIDGAGNHSVEQIGTTWTAAKGWYAWVELFGDTNGQGKGQYYYETPISSFSVHAGDVISASVKFVGNTATGSEFSFGITDQSTSGSIGSTQGWSNMLTTQYIQPARTTGEWIVEAPSNNSGVVPLANFGKVAFSQAWATAGGVSGPVASFPYYPEFISQTSAKGGNEDYPTNVVNNYSAGYQTVTGGFTSSFNVVFGPEPYVLY